MTRPSRPATGDRAAVIPIVALVLPVLILMTAFAVDLGQQRNSRRTLQARADVISLDMMRLVDGRSSYELWSDPTTDQAFRASAERNEMTITSVSGGVAFGPNELRVEMVWGRWGQTTGFQPHHEPGIAPAQTDGFGNVLVPNAVRVTASEVTEYRFQPGSGSATRSAVAALEPDLPDDDPGDDPNDDPSSNRAIATIRVGSLLAGIHPQLPEPTSPVGQARLDATVRALNSLLASQYRPSGEVLPNAETAFDLVGYRGLAAGEVHIDRIAAELGFGTTTELLDSHITVGELFDGAIGALDNQAQDGDPNAATAAAQLASFRTALEVTSSAELRLWDVFRLSQGQRGAAASTAVNVLDLVRGGAQAIDGNNFFSFRFTPDLPGVSPLLNASAANVQMHVIERMQQARGPVGTSASTAQVRLEVDLQVDVGQVFQGAAVRLPLVIEVARATAELIELTCTSPAEDSWAGVDVATGAVTVHVGTVSDLTAGDLQVSEVPMFHSNDLTLVERTVRLLLSDLFSGSVFGRSGVTLWGDTSYHEFFPFDPPDEWQRAGGGTTSTVFAELDNNFTSSTLSLLGLDNLLEDLVPYFNESLDDLVIVPLLQAAGVTIGAADLLAHDMVCGGPTLVQEGARLVEQ